MQDYQYFHFNHSSDANRRYTVCFDMPKKEFFYKLFTLFGNKEFGTKIGISIVHPTDRYVKKIGRAVAKEKMESKAFVITGVDFHEKETILHANDTLRNIYLVISLKKDRERARLLEVHLNGSIK